MKLLILTLGVVLGLLTSVSDAATGKKGTLAVKAGDSIYVAACCEKCECGLVSTKPAKCCCDKDLTKVTVTEVKGKKAHYVMDGKKHSVKLVGKYTCPCTGDCCDIIAQKPVKCGCGKEMVKVGK